MGSDFTVGRRSKAGHVFAAIFAATVEANDAVGTNTNRGKNTAIFVVALLSPFTFALGGLRVQGSGVVTGVVIGTTGAVTDFRTNIVWFATRRTVAYA